MSVGRAASPRCAPTYGVLLSARMLQGAGAAAVPTLGVAILSARYEGSVRGLAFGRLAGTAAAISCLGPLAGGAVEGRVRLARGDGAADPRRWPSCRSCGARCTADGTGARLDVDRRRARRGHRRRDGAARAVALRRALAVAAVGVSAAGPRRPRGPGLRYAAGPHGFLPLRGGPQPAGGAQRGRRRRRPGLVVRDADRAAGGAAQPTAGRPGRSAWRWCRARSSRSACPGSPGRCSTRVGAGPVARHRRHWSPRPRWSIAALGAHWVNAPLLVRRDRAGDVRVRPRAARAQRRGR